MNEAALTKIHVDLPLHWCTGGESLWAEDLGGDLYRIRNVPFFAYDLNLADVVRGTPYAPDQKPELREVVERSGHSTMRVFFDETYPVTERVPLLRQLKRHEASFERATEAHFAIDIEPTGSFNDVYDQLAAWEEAGFLSFETCEARVPGSFDDRPTEH